MKKILTIYLTTLSFFCSAQGLVNNGAVLKVTSGTTFRVDNGSITNKSSGTIDNNGNMYLDATFDQTTGATYTGGAASWLWFEGTTNQNATSDAPLNIAKLRVDNGNRLILGNTVNISDRVDLINNGKIELGVHNLVLAPTATLTGYDLNNFIITNSTGFLQRQVGAASVDFPVGNTSYNLATLSNSGTADNLQVRIFEQVFDQGTTGTIETSGAVNRTWMISEETVGGSNVTMTLQWNTPDELVPFDRANCGIAHHTSGTLWDNPSSFTSATPIGAAWSQTRSGFTSFSPFIVRDLSIDLPVELLYFNAVRKSISLVNLDWSTASELNNQGFEVERMLEFETEFTKIGWVAGNGTTTNTSYYNLVDANGYEGVSYYRLKQIDFDGTSTYSDIRAVSGWKSKGTNIDIFPNPINDYINIRLTSNSKEITLRLIDAKGALILSSVRAVPSDKLLVLNDLSQLADGVYMLTVTTDDGEVLTKKIVKKQF